ncbi:MAG: hypothetical protein DRH90_16530 [Deltaproteobacteria bacterium]|nr:MAG: hypothetical protein DRH90_16530 [Deltaproteobacteria bacterium]RLC16870.1 MAG: hypothetical protein DRI24_07290 [Deltaproteobacteria bacterium]
MMAKKLLLVLVIAVAMIAAGPVPSLLAAEPPGTNNVAEKIVGPTMWAVAVIDCSAGPAANVRVKKIEGCVVNTQAVDKWSLKVQPISPCPPTESQIVYTRFQPSKIFGLPCPAIITKVKNYHKEDDSDLVSFDAQIQFVILDNVANKDITECK